MEQTFEVLLKLAFSSALITIGMIAGLIWLSRSWLLAKISASVRFPYDEKLETLRASLAKQREIDIAGVKKAIEDQQSAIAAARSAISGAQSAAAERRLNALDTVWNSVVRERDAFPLVLKIVDVVTPSELRETFKKGSRTFSGFSYENWHAYLVAHPRTKTELCRPYIGDTLFGLCELYKAFNVRLITHILEMQSHPGSPHWTEDSATAGVVRALLAPDQFRHFEKLEYGKIAFLQNIVETRIAASIAKLISGEQLAQQTMEQGQALISALAKLDIESDPRNPPSQNEES